MKTLFCVIGLCLAASPGLAREKIQMEGTTIVGNQELPKVLYIVPWKSSKLPDMDEPPLQQLVNEALTPLERDVFRRQIILHQSLQGSTDKSETQ